MKNGNDNLLPNSLWKDLKKVHNVWWKWRKQAHLSARWVILLDNNNNNNQIYNTVNGFLSVFQLTKVTKKKPTVEVTDCPFQ